MCDGPDSGLITQTRQQTPEHCLKVGAFAPGSSMSGLIEHPAHVFVAFRRTAAGVLFGAFFLSGTGRETSWPSPPLRRSPAELNRCPDRVLPPVVSRRPDAASWPAQSGCSALRFAHQVTAVAPTAARAFARAWDAIFLLRLRPAVLRCTSTGRLPTTPGSLRRSRRWPEHAGCEDRSIPVDR